MQKNDQTNIGFKVTRYYNTRIFNARSKTEVSLWTNGFNVQFSSTIKLATVFFGMRTDFLTIKVIRRIASQVCIV